MESTNIYAWTNIVNVKLKFQTAEFQSTDLKKLPPIISNQITPKWKA